MLKNRAGDPLTLKSIEEQLDFIHLVNLIEKCLDVNPETRIRPSQAI